MDHPPPPQYSPTSRRWRLPQIHTHVGGYAEISTAPPYSVNRPPWGERQFKIPRKPVPTREVVSESTSDLTARNSEDDVPPTERGEQLPRDSPWFFGFSVLCTLAPCFAVGLGIVTMNLHGREISEWGARVESIILLAPTIYPVLFAALMSKALRSIAINMAAKGTTLGKLEQLLGSGTVGGNIATAFSLGMVNIITIILLVLWALSPLGGQAALRMLRTQNIISERIPTTLWYRHSDTDAEVTGTNAMSYYKTRIDAACLGSMLARSDLRDRPIDIFNHIKIPWIESLNNSKVQEDGWIPVEGNRTEAYSSLLGIPWQFVRSDGKQTADFELPFGNATFSLESSYYRLDCDKPQNASKNDVGGNLIDLIYNRNSVQKNPPINNMVLDMSEEDRRSGRLKSLEISRMRPPTIEFLSRLDFISHRKGNTTVETEYFNYAKCTMNNVFVESKVTCVDQACSVTAMRHSRLPIWEPYTTRLDGTGTSIIEPLFKLVGQSGIETTNNWNGHVSGTEQYIMNPGKGWFSGRGDKIPVVNLTSEVFSRRLSTILNTYWSAMLTPEQMVGLNVNLSSFDPPLDAFKPLNYVVENWTPEMVNVRANLVNTNGSVPFAARRTEVEFTALKPHYVVTGYWLASFIISSVFLFLVSLIGLVLQIRRKAPDIFMVSGIVRDSRYISLSGKDDISTQDGDEKSRRLKDMRVILADVDPEAQLGRVAFIGMDQKGNSWRQLTRERRYR